MSFGRAGVRAKDPYAVEPPPARSRHGPSPAALDRATRENLGGIDHLFAAAKSTGTLDIRCVLYSGPHTTPFAL